MRLLIDGYNLLHASKWLDAEGNDEKPPDMRAVEKNLLERLARQLAGTSIRATVVFDASPVAPMWTPTRSTEFGIEVVRTVDHTSADEAIVEMIEQDTGPRDLVVVSTDRVIREAAKKRGARVVKSEQFWQWLRTTAEATRRGAESCGEEKPGYVSKREVNQTVDQFRKHRAVSPTTDPKARRPRRPRLVIRRRRTRKLR